MILDILAIIIFYYFAFFIGYCLFFSIAGKIKKRKSITQFFFPPKKFAIIIPSYEEDEVIISSVENCLHHNYPKECFDIIIAGEGHLPETLLKIESLGAKMIQLKGMKKGAAIEAACNMIENYDYVLILDADNVMGKDCLLKMNEALQNGAKVVQGHRKAKNMNNSIEILDSLSEEINNHIFRKGSRAVGLSSALIGSGMGFEFSYLKKIMQKMEGIWEDREMELRILHDRVTIEYLDDAIIYDEKVSSSDVFVKQRCKWLSGQIMYIKKSFHFHRNSCELNMDLMNKFLQSVCPPRSLLLGFLILLSLIEFGFSTSLPKGYWLNSLICYITSLAIAIPTDLIDRNLFKAILKSPFLILLMFAVIPLSLIRAKVHYHTPHIYK